MPLLASTIQSHTALLLVAIKPYNKQTNTFIYRGVYWLAGGHLTTGRPYDRDSISEIVVVTRQNPPVSFSVHSSSHFQIQRF